MILRRLTKSEPRPRTTELASEMERLEGQASHLVRFLATRSDSPAVRVRISTLARWGSRRSNASSRSSLVMTHTGCTSGGGSVDAFSMVAT
jgi:hypothetical protein